MKRLMLLIAVAIAVGLYVYYHKEVRTTDNPTSATYYGSIEIRRVNLGFRVSGKIATLEREEGEFVRAGDLIATLDAEPYDVEVASAEAMRDQARATLERLENGARKQEIDEARANVEECRATLALSEAEFTRNEQLVKNHAVSVSDYDASSASLEVAKARLSRAISTLELLEEGTRAEEIAAARATLAQMEAALRKARIAREDASLYAPNDGVVLTRVCEPGAIITAGQTIGALSLRDAVWAYIFLEERDLCRVALGTPVELRTDSSNKTYRGHIGYVSPEAEFTPKTVETPNLRTNLVYRTRVVVDEPDDYLRQGAPIEVVVPFWTNPSSTQNEGDDE